MSGAVAVAEKPTVDVTAPDYVAAADKTVSPIVPDVGSPVKGAGMAAVAPKDGLPPKAPNSGPKPVPIVRECGLDFGGDVAPAGKRKSRSESWDCDEAAFRK